MPNRLPTRAQIEAALDNTSGQGAETELRLLEDTGKLFACLGVNEGAQQLLTTTPTRLDIFEDTARAEHVILGGLTSGYESSIYVPVECYIETHINISLAHSSGANRNVFIELYCNGNIFAKGGKPEAPSNYEIMAPLHSINWVKPERVLDVRAYVDSGTAMTTFTAGSFSVKRVR